MYRLFVLLTLVLIAGISTMTYASARVLKTWRPDFNPLLQPSDIAMRLLVILACIGLGYLSGLPFPQLGWTFPNPVLQVGLGLLIGALMAVTIAGVTRWLVARTGDRFYSAQIAELLAPQTRREILWVGLALVPAVLLEELLFRSLLIGGFSPILPVYTLLLGGAVLFGLLHTPQGIWGVAGAGIAGLVFGVLFLVAGSLLLPVVAHYATNLFQLSWLYIQRRRERTDQTTDASSNVVG
ncbi:MAG: CPBP family intramembrane metalloprotease [Anaerolineales bacterium]|nr:CPBP family intramembrane metalloprotease [Anaerolineales bacterium]